MVKIGIIGGGFTGLGTAYYLKNVLKNEDEIVIFENNDHVGGLAAGFKTKEWDWPVDKVIHHWFTTDKWALSIAREMGLAEKLIIKDTKSSCFYHGKIAELDSPLSLLKFPFLPLFDRLRMGAVMAWLRLDKNYFRYEKWTAFDFLKKTMGFKAFKVVWEPLFRGKFGKHAEKVNAAWFWARVHPRTKSLAYIEGGFQGFADSMAEKIRERKGRIILNADVKSVKKKGNGFEVISGKDKFSFDYIVMAVPLQIALNICDFPEDYKRRHEPLKSIGAQYFVLELEKPFLPDGSYWLNVNESKFPFMMVAEHTNFIDKRHYDNKHIIWVGKYLNYDHPLWKMNEKKLLGLIVPFLKKINPGFEKSWIKRSFFTRFGNAQPIMPLNYSRKIPSIKTPIEKMFIANMNHVYPWDRGTNNALGLGERVAKEIKRSLRG